MNFIWFLYECRPDLEHESLSIENIQYVVLSNGLVRLALYIFSYKCFINFKLLQKQTKQEPSNMNKVKR